MSEPVEGIAADGKSQLLDSARLIETYSTIAPSQWDNCNQDA